EGNVGIGIINPSNKLHIIHNGDYPGLAVNQSGEGNSSVFTIDNTGNSAAALEASSNGTGHVIQARHFGLEGNAGRFRIDNAGNSNVALYARTDGDGPALGGNNMGNGIAGFFNILDSNNDKTALEVKTNGIGSAGIFEIDNNSNTEAALVAVTNGTGPALHIQDVMRIEPSTVPGSPSEGDIYMDSTTHKLMVYDGSTWQACW
ncbi:MAG: hypothetical protein GWP19_11040, partial [Planctomycetia bacterium]|nr:hypothetical protein [Planctomycetia bacterium]